MDTLEYAVEGRLARLVLNRPEKRNAVNGRMRQELWEAFTDLRDNEGVWGALITGKGTAFCAGHDLSEPFADARPSFDDLYSLQTSICKPLVAAVNGACLAQGGAIALACDLIVASEEAVFGWPQVKRGISSISGPTMLARRVPLNVAFEILFTGDFLSARRALELNLVNRVVPAASLLPEAEALARKILENAPLAVSAMKEVTLKTLDLPADEAYRVAKETLRRLEGTADAREGLAAFREKRKPEWKRK